jgi:methyl-accepting chemotaxis protein
MRTAIERMGGFDRAKDIYKSMYLTNNPNPPGSKQNLLEADNSEYSKAHGQALSFFSAIIKERNYYDAFLIDAKNGNILFTVAKEEDYMTSLSIGPYRDSNLGKLYRKIINSPDGGQQAHIVDYEPYAVSNNQINSFIGTGIFVDGRLEGILVFQLPLDEISNKIRKPIVKNRKETSFLVGPDFLLRSDYEENSKESSILKKKFETEPVKKALSGESGITVTTGISGGKTFTAYTPIELLGVKYALLIDLDYDETLSSLTSFQTQMFFITIIVLAVMALASFFLSRVLSKPIQESVNILSTSIREISSVIDNHERTANMQSASVNQTTTTISNIGNSSRLSAEESQVVTMKAKDAQDLAVNGHNSVLEMIQSIDTLKLRVSGIAEQILRLSEKNSQISNIIGLVSELANETNMLALNAAVEAARAGENGKGFEVVAVEIRKLADESKKSALKIQEIISEIKKATDSTVMATEEGVKRADDSARLGSKVLDSLSGINHSVAGVFDSIEKISINIRQQSISMNEIVSAMNSINRGSQESASGIAQTKVGVNQISDATRKLRDLVEGQKII